MYAVASLLLCLVQGLVLRQITVWDVFPFLFPIMAATVGLYEGPIPGVVFGAALGMVCDLTIVAPLPSFYTLVFPLAGLAAALIAESLISAGFICAVVCSALAFALTDGFHILLLLLFGEKVWPTAYLLMARETGLSLLCTPLVFFPFRAVHRRCHTDD